MISKDLLIEANEDPAITGFVYPNKNLTRIPIEFDGKVVGFATPRQDQDSIWRMGAIYIKPFYRGKGLGTKAIIDFMRNKKGRAFIENDNISSQKAYEKAGFKRVKESKEKDGFWYQNF